MRCLPSRSLHGLEFVDTLLGVALSDHFQCFVFVAARRHILLMQTIVICDLVGILNGAQLVFESLNSEKNCTIDGSGNAPSHTSSFRFML